MLNPNELLKEWLQTINESDLQDIAALLSTSPSFALVREAFGGDNMLDEFWETIDRHSEPSLENAVFLVNFKATFDYMFSSRSSNEEWDITEKRHKAVMQSPDLTPRMKEHLARMIEILPERRATWIELYKSWEDLKANALSDNNIRAWEQTRRFENVNQELPSIN